MLKYVFSKVW